MGYNGIMKEPKPLQYRAVIKEEGKEIPMNVPPPDSEPEEKETMTIAELKANIANLQTALEENRIGWEQDNHLIAKLRKELAQIEKDEEEIEKMEKSEKEQIEKLEIEAKERNRQRDISDGQMWEALRQAKEAFMKAKENRTRIITNRVAKYGKIGALVAGLGLSGIFGVKETAKKIGASGHRNPDKKIIEKYTEAEKKDFYIMKTKTFSEENKRSTEGLAKGKIANLSTLPPALKIDITEPIVTPTPDTVLEKKPSDTRHDQKSELESTPIPEPLSTEEITAKKQEELEVKFDKKSPENDTIFSHKLATIEKEQNRLNSPDQ